MGLLSNRRRYSKPYDYEIEYLEFTGEQFIDLGIKGSLDIGIDIEFSMIEEFTPMSIIGCRSNYNSNNIYVLTSPNDKMLYVDFYTRTPYSITRIPTSYSSRFRVIDNRYERAIYENGILIGRNTNVCDTDFSTPHNIYVGYRDPLDTIPDTISNFIGKLYSVKITLGGDTILDLIPVRKGNIGYMYNKIDGKLYGNSGTGEFIFGADIK